MRASSYTPHPFVTLGDSMSLTGMLTYPGCTTTGLTMKNGATFVYTNDIPNLASVTFEPGATLNLGGHTLDLAITATQAAFETIAST